MKRSIFVKEQLEKTLDLSGLVQSGDKNYSGAINEALQRYFHICARSRPVLSVGEWETIKAALDWELENDLKHRSIPFIDDPRRLPIIFENYLEDLDAGRNTSERGLPSTTQSFAVLKRKYAISGISILGKLKSMTFAELVSVLQAVEAEVNLVKVAEAEATEAAKKGNLGDDGKATFLDPVKWEAACAEASAPKWVEAIGWDHCQANPDSKG